MEKENVMDVLGWFNFEYQAEERKTLLEKHGIPVIVEEDETVGGFKVLVRPADQNMALNIIREDVGE